MGLAKHYKPLQRINEKTRDQAYKRRKFPGRKWSEWSLQDLHEISDPFSNEMDNQFRPWVATCVDLLIMAKAKKV